MKKKIDMKKVVWGATLPNGKKIGGGNLDILRGKKLKKISIKEKIILTTEEQKLFDMMFKRYLMALKAKALHPLYMTKSSKIGKKILAPGAVLRTKSGKIKRFRLRKLK